jgi:hypothetical protein
LLLLVAVEVAVRHLIFYLMVEEEVLAALELMLQDIH